MTNKRGQPSRGRAHRAVSFAVFALLFLCLPGSASAQWATNGNNINNTNTGNVGVGTTTPVYKFSVRTAIAYDGLRLDGNTNWVALFTNLGEYSYNNITKSGDRGIFYGGPSAGNPGGGFVIAPWMDATSGIRLDAAGNVGVGTQTPHAKLDARSASPKTDPVQHIVFTAGSSEPDTPFLLSVQWFGNSVLSGRRIELQTTERNIADGGNLNLQPRAGNVGVGTTAPAAKLHVAGDIRVDGNINAKYQDVAEWVPSTQKLSAGTVVILDPERPNHVLASNAPYDTAVAGVISARPGLTLGEAGDDKALVATTGRVKVKVDATKGAIKVGDLLVTSGTSGVAMKSQPLDLGGVPIHRPGTLIGKALEPLAGGTGEILVLLSLQ